MQHNKITKISTAVDYERAEYVTHMHRDVKIQKQLVEEKILDILLGSKA